MGWLMEISEAELRELDRNARAYGWEIGRGQRLGERITASPDNPFLREDWDRGLV